MTKITHTVCELAIEALHGENAGLREDLAWCREVIAASIDALHLAHVRELRYKESIASLRESLRARLSGQSVDRPRAA